LLAVIITFGVDFYTRRRKSKVKKEGSGYYALHGNSTAEVLVTVVESDCFIWSRDKDDKPPMRLWQCSHF